MINDLIYVGIGLLVLALVWGILFVCHISPIKSRCWSVADKLNITVEKCGGKGNRKFLTIATTLKTFSPIKVNRMSLLIGGNKIISFDWESHEVKEDESKYVDFKRPKWLPNGSHSARLIAYTPDGSSKSETFRLEVKD